MSMTLNFFVSCPNSSNHKSFRSLRKNVVFLAEKVKRGKSASVDDQGVIFAGKTRK